MGSENRSEGYTLIVPADGGEAVVTANSTLGLFRGLSTFEQLWYEVDGTVYAPDMPLRVEDGPAYVFLCFSFAGLLLLIYVYM